MGCVSFQLYLDEGAFSNATERRLRIPAHPTRLKRSPPDILRDQQDPFCPIVQYQTADKFPRNPSAVLRLMSAVVYWLLFVGCCLLVVFSPGAP